MPVGMALITRAAGRGRMGRVMGVLGVQQLLGPVLGPVIGGVLVEHAGWRWIFYVNVPVGVLAILAAARFLPRAAPAAVPPARRTRVPAVVAGDRRAGLRLVRDLGARTAFSTARTLVPLLLGVIAGDRVRPARGPHPRRVDRRAPVPRARLLGRRRRRRSSSAWGCSARCSCCRSTTSASAASSPLEAGLLLAPQGIGAANHDAVRRPAHRPGRPRARGARRTRTRRSPGTLPFALAGYVDARRRCWRSRSFVRGVGLGASTMPAMAGAYASARAEPTSPRASSVLNVTKRLGELRRRGAGRGRPRAPPARRCRSRPPNARRPIASVAVRLPLDLLVGPGLRARSR